jgi:hypothetical protein
VSLDATRWAWAQEVDTGAQRLVLLAMADLCRRRSQIVFPSRERLHAMTRLDAKTITRAKGGLVSLGLIVPTGEHRGKSGRISVYALNFASGNGSENVSIMVSANSTGSGSIPASYSTGTATSMEPDLPPNRSGSPSECTQERVDQMPPETVHRTRVDLVPEFEPGRKVDPCRAAAAGPSAPDGAQEKREARRRTAKLSAKALEAWTFATGFGRKVGESDEAFTERARAAWARPPAGADR